MKLCLMRKACLGKGKCTLASLPPCIPIEYIEKMKLLIILLIFFVSLVLHNILNLMSLRILWPYRPGVVKVIEEFKLSVYGDNYDEESAVGNASETTKKRKAATENAVKENANYDWADLADNGKVKLKCFVMLHLLF